MSTENRCYDAITAAAELAAAEAEQDGRSVKLVTLSDCTPNRGTVAYYGPSFGAALAATRGYGDSHVFVADDSEPEVGQRAWHRGAKAGV